MGADCRLLAALVSAKKELKITEIETPNDCYDKVPPAYLRRPRLYPVHTRPRSPPACVVRILPAGRAAGRPVVHLPCWDPPSQLWQVARYGDAKEPPCHVRPRMKHLAPYYLE